MLALFFLLPAGAVFVSPSGNDAWAGTLRQPVASISRAVELSRSQGLHRIEVEAGEYRLMASIALDARDSGLVIEGWKEARPLVTGAVIVPAGSISVSRDSALQARAVGLDKDAVGYQIDVKSIADVVLSPFTPYGFPRPVAAAPSELFSGAKPMTIARWPNEGFTTVKSVREPGNGESDQNKPPIRPIFTAVTDRAKSWKSIGSAWLYGYWKYDWADETIKLHSVDPVTGEITLETPHVYGVAAGTPFYVENLPEELDAVGEYYADPAAGSVQFVAKKGDRATYRLSQLGEPLIVLNKADHVTIRGLDFGYSRGDGADVSGCAFARIEGCQFFDLGERAAVLEGGHDSGLNGCNIWDTGEGGVVLDGGDRNRLTPAKLYVENCDIHDYMRRTATYRPGVSMSGVGNRVSHCAIHDAPHSAIIFSGNDHLIQFNEFYRTISRTGDGGVIYTGRNWTARGTRIDSNYFHDNIGIKKWEVAIYFDDQASGLIATGNLIERSHWGFLIGGGRDNLVANNQIVDCDEGFQCDSRGLGWAANGKSGLLQSLAAVPYQSDVWRSEYPSLATILDGDPMTPAGNVIRDNTCWRCGTMKVADAPFDKLVQFVGNRDLKVGSPSRAAVKWGLVRDAVRRSLPK